MRAAVHQICFELTRSCALAAFLLPSVLSAPSSASQNQLSSPTTGTVSGLQLTNNYNNALDSLNTANSGATAPTNQLSGSASLGNWWLNISSSPYPLGMNDGSSNWPAIGAIDATNHYWDLQIGGGTATVASAATTDLCAVPQNYLTISGTTTITSFGSTCHAGVLKVVIFSGSLTLTYNAASLIIPGAGNVITTAGDQAMVAALGAGNWQVVSYTPANGQALINPAIDVGDYVMTALTAPPSSKYLFAYGQAVSRSTYATLLAGITITQSVTRTNGSPTLTGFSDTTQIGPGACVEGAGIPNAGSCTTTIVSCTSTTCTISNNASSSGTANVTIFPNGNGDGATTFNLPDCQGTVLAGRDNMSGTPAARLTSTYFGTNPDALGVTGGSQSQTLAQANLPNVNFAVNIPAGQGSHSHGPSTSGFSFWQFNPMGTGQVGTTSGTNTTGFGTTGAATLPAMSGTAASGGSGTPLATTQPTKIVNCMMRVLSKFETAPGALPQFATNNASDVFAIVDRRRRAA